MKNLFDYAKKELSQDAFLLWLFSNYDCEQREVNNFSRYMLAYLIDNNFQLCNIQNISNVNIKSQFKNMDILVECEFNGKQYIVIIEDKTSTTHNSEQLAQYEKVSGQCYDNFEKKFVYYKTNLIGWEEKQSLETRYSSWDIYDINRIVQIFDTFLKTVDKHCFNNEILQYYYEHILKIQKEILLPQEQQSLSDWTLRSWQAFFEQYIPVDGLKHPTEIRAHQNQYYYIKFIIDGHEKDLPCVEFRSRDYDKNTVKLRFLVVLYNLTGEQITVENINKWQNVLTKYNFKLTNRQDLNKHKQIGVIERNIENSVNDLTHVFDEIGKLLIEMYAQQNNVSS